MARALKVLTASGRAVRRLVFYGLLPLILLVVLTGQIVLTEVVELAARSWLSEHGLDDLDFSVESIQLHGSTITDVSLGDGALTIERVALAYDPDRLREGRADRMTISGLRWKTRLIDGALDLGPLRRILALGGSGASSGSSPPSASPVPEVELRDAEFTITSEIGEVVIPASGVVRISPSGRITGEATIAPRTAFASLRAAIEFDRAPTDSTIDLFAEIADGWALGPGVTALGIGGQVAVHVGADGSIEADGYLDAAHLNTPIGDLPGSATFAVSDDTVRGTLNLAMTDGAVALAVVADGGLRPRPNLNFAVEFLAPSTAALERRALSLFDLGENSPRLAVSGQLEAASIAALVEAPGLVGLVAAVSGHGAIEVAISELSVPRLIRGMNAAGKLDLSLADGSFQLDTEAISLSAAMLDGQLFGVGPRHLLHPYLVGGGEVRLTPRDAPVVIVTVGDDQTLDISVAGDLSLVLGEVLAARAGADRIHVKMGVEGVSWRGVERGRFTLDKWTARPFGLAITEARAAIDGTGGRFGGTASVAASGALQIPGGPRADDVDLSLATTLSFSGDHLTVKLAKPRLASMGALVLPGENAVTVAPIALRGGDEQPRALLDARFSDDGSVRWTSAVMLAAIPLEAAIDLGADGAAAISATLPPLSIVGSGTIGDAERPSYDIAIDGKGGEARLATPLEPLPGLPLDATAENFSISATIKEGRPSRLSIEVARLAQNVRRPLMPPLAMSFNATVDTDSLAFDTRLCDDSGNLVIDIAGRHDLARGQGQGEITLYPLIFLENGLQPSRLTPYFADRIGPTTGRISLAGPVFWSDAGVTSALVLAIEKLDTAIDAVTITGVNAAITLDRLLPPSTLPSQQIAIGGIDLGLPLTDGRVAMRLDRDGQPLIERSEWLWAGGKVATSYVRGVAGTKNGQGGDRLVLEIDGIALDRLLELTPQGTNIEATGTLFGRIPVVFRDGDFVIVDGWLESSFEGGTIRYSAQELAPGLLAGGAGVSLLLDALDNFIYSRLRVDLSGLPDGQTEMRFRIRGKNPDVYGGAEVEFNMSITGRLEQILRQSYQASFEVPERIARKLANEAKRLEGGTSSDEEQ